MTKIEIKGKEYNFYHTNRGEILYENRFDKSFDPIKAISRKEQTDYFYYLLLGANKGSDIEYDDFCDWIDEDEVKNWMSLQQEMVNYYKKVMEYSPKKKIEEETDIETDEKN